MDECCVGSGRAQAAMTGARLRQANITYTEIVHSTLDRAVQTADVISQYLAGVPLRADDLLVEGGPVPPIPTVTYWQLPMKVCRSPRQSCQRVHFMRPDPTRPLSRRRSPNRRIRRRFCPPKIRRKNYGDPNLPPNFASRKSAVKCLRRRIP